MLNYIWLGMILVAVIVGGLTGRLGEVSTTLVDKSQYAVMELVLPLGGLITLWLGIVRLVERSGMIVILSRVLRPVLRLLFPSVPADHPAMGAMVLNMGANMLGAGNAATPLGLRAMQQLDRLNPHKGTATDAMAMFLAINTSSVTIIPATAVGVLAAEGASNPTAIIGPAILATLCSTLVAVVAARFLSRLPVFSFERAAASAKADEKTAEASKSGDDRGDEAFEVAQPVRLALWKKAVLWALAVGFACFYVGGAWPHVFAGVPAEEVADMDVLKRFILPLSNLAMPFFIAFFPLHAALSGVKVFEEFVEGAREGMQVALRILPFVLGIFVAMSMLRDSGALPMAVEALRPVLGAFGFPADLLPMALMRPLSGGGSLGVLSEIVASFGADHLLSRTAATMFGSTETTLYVAAVYFGAVSIRRTRHAILAGLTADAAGLLAAVAVCRAFFA